MKRITCRALAGITAAAIALPAQAQIEDILVTAQKREASLQETAISVAVVDGDLMQDIKLDELQDLILQTPSMAFSRAGGEGQIFIRGVGANLLGIGQDPSVAVHQDGVYLGRPNLVLNQFLDVERVEVLRGPQGTLYGRNATAGVINVISRKPGDEAEGYVRAYYGNFNRAEVVGAVGGPISDTVGFRLAGRWQEDDGFTDDLDPRGGDEIDDDGIWSLRGIFDYEPSEDFRAEFITEYGEASNGNRSVRRRDGLHISQSGLCPTCPALPNPAFDETRNDLDTFHDWEVLGLTMTLEGRLTDQLTLTSVSGYRDFEDDFSFNTDGTEAFVTNTQYRRSATQLSQELRLAYTSERIDWLLGAFVFTEEKEENLGLPAVGFGGSFNIFAINETDAWAVFGELGYRATDRLKLVAGLRYNDEQKDDCSRSNFVVGDFTGLNNPAAFVPACAPGTLRPAGWDDWTPKLGLEYSLSDDVFVYGTITQGFKSGGTNSLAPGATPFDQEEILSYEAGLKSDLYGGKLRINAAAFYYDYDDLQVSTFDATTSTTRIENAASATVLGLELDVSAILLDGLVFNFGASWLDTEYDDFVTTFGVLPGTTTPNVVDVSGNNLINAPELKLVTNLRYDWETATGALYLFGQVSWQDEVFHSQFNEGTVGQDAYTLVDLRAGYVFGAERNWEIALLARNLFDEEYFQNSVRFTSLSNATTDPGRIGAALGYPGEGRSWGAQLRYAF